jgi:hypothetical protein
VTRNRFARAGITIAGVVPNDSFAVAGIAIAGIFAGGGLAVVTLTIAGVLAHRSLAVTGFAIAGIPTNQRLTISGIAVAGVATHKPLAVSRAPGAIAGRMGRCRGIRGNQREKDKEQREYAHPNPSRSPKGRPVFHIADGSAVGFCSAREDRRERCR